MLLIGAAAAAPAPAHAAAPAALSAPVKKDLRCFLLYAAAVGHADSSKDTQAKNAGSFGVMYFFGKLKTEAPTLDLFSALRDEAISMESDPQLKESGTACDTEFQNAGSQLMELGKRLQQLAPQSSPSS